MRLIIFILLFAFQTAWGAFTGPEDSYYVVHDLSQDWHIYNEDNLQFIPAINTNERVNTLFFPKYLYNSYTLLIKVEDENGFLFINGLFHQKLKINQWNEILISQLSSKNEEVIVTLFGSFDIKSTQVFIGSKKDKTQEKSTLQIQRSSLLEMKLRPSKPFHNILTFLFGFLILFTTIISVANPKAFKEYFNLSDIMVVNIRETKFLISKPLSRINIAFVILLSLVTSVLFLLVADNEVYLFDNPFQLSKTISTTTFFLTFLKLFLYSFVIFIGKYFLIQITGNLFGVNKSINIHYFKTIQFTLYFLLLFTIFFYLISILPLSNPPIYSKLLFWTAVLFFSLRTLLIYFSILKSTGIRSLYLFAYLCVVEILPVFIGIKLAF